ncbi:leukocyte immunoglobulin-like receptor subfamily B member 3 isoform X2 [Odocoileus virginianus]|uniref:Leukocyte immunoglobulin-like receptor subfamily B member 3 isoform X2 n=1 Tax=Odocoileus virginianus TaxID=9874 RepID=A0ABM4GST3_ODOVR
MRVSATTLTFTALLCLGLCWGPGNQGQPEVLPKPSIRADPGTMVAQGSPVTIWCQGSLMADVYHLYKERGSVYWEAQAPQGSRNKAGFHFEYTSSSYAGQYQCAYYSRNRWSERSDLLPLVVTGVYRAPSLSAQPSPVVAAGGSVTLTCSSQYAAGTLHLLKEGGADLPRYQTSRNYGNQGREEAVFPVGPVNSSHGGTYRCYDAPSNLPYLWSRPSDPLHLQVTGLSRAPSLSAQPGSLVLPGDNLTLRCGSEAGFGSFALTKDEQLSPPLRLEGQQDPDFPLGRVSRAHGGRYRCYSGQNLSHTWSAPSAPLDILIAGMHRKPSLSARPGASVPQGENVTLQCRSEVRSDTFYLSKEGSPAPPQHLRLQDTAPPVQANFTLRAVTSAHGGTYRCYGSHSTAPHLLSLPSDPLELLVSGGSGNQLLPALESGPGLTWYLSVLIGVSVTFVLLLLVLLFLFLRHRGQDRRRTSAAASVLEDRGRQKSSSPAADAPEESLYCAVTEDAWPEHSRARASQAATPEAPQDVTYAQLDHSVRQGETAPSNQQPGERPAEPSVYATLALH